MKDDLLSTFLTVAESNSFSKAAEILYLTPNAVKKRIEALESQIEVTLFTRSNKGVMLTHAGTSLYADLKQLSGKINEALIKAKNIQQNEETVLHIGIMGTFAELFLTSKWLDAPVDSKSISHLIKYGSALSDLDIMLNRVGKEIDVAIDVFQPQVAAKYGLYIEKISDFSLYLGYIGNDSSLETILKSTTVNCLFPARASCINEIISKLQELHPQAVFEFINDYSFWTIQKVIESRHSIIVFENQMRLIPFLRFIKIPAETKISFGVYYKEKTNNIQHFLELISHN